MQTRTYRKKYANGFVNSEALIKSLIGRNMLINGCKFGGSSVTLSPAKSVNPARETVPLTS